MGLFLRTDLGGSLWVTRGELGVFERVILGADLGLFGVHFASGMGGDVREELWHA